VEIEFDWHRTERGQPRHGGVVTLLGHGIAEELQLPLRGTPIRIPGGKPVTG
jgi:hypothetical protein